MSRKSNRSTADKLNSEYFEDVESESKIPNANTAGELNAELCRPILENNPDLIILQSMEGDTLFISSQCFEITGFNPRDLLGNGYVDRIHSDDRDLIVSIWKDAIKHSKTVVFDYRFLDRENETIWLSHRSSILHLDDETSFIQNNIRNITIQKQFEETLLEVDKRLTENNVMMKNKNIALEELLNQVETQKTRLNDRIRANIFHLVTPLLNELLNRNSGKDRKIVELILKNLESVSSQFGSKISNKIYSLSSRELEISNMIKEGLSSKDIADILKIEVVTVSTHRNNIRKKLGIRNSEINLTTYLNSL